MTSWRMIVSLAVVATGLAGCSTTLVESVPIGTVTTCDRAWPGTWRAAEHGQGKVGVVARLTINADCSRMTFTDDEKSETDPAALRLLTTRAGQFLIVSKPGEDSTVCLGDGHTRCGIELIHYVRNGERIELFQPDHAKVHAALEAHVVSGFTQMRVGAQDPAANGTQTGIGAVPPGLAQARAAAQDDKQVPTYRNLIAGSPEQVTQILLAHPEFFSDEPWLILLRDGPMNPGTVP